METLTTLEIAIGLLALVSSLIVVIAPNPIVSSMGLLGTLFLTGGLYFAMGAFFIGAAQILIYAGAIAVLFVFIVMLLDIKPITVRLPGRTPIIALGVLAGVFFVAAAVIATVQSSGSLPTGSNSAESTLALVPLEIARLFVTKYMVAFQMTGFLILAAIIGAILLGRPEKTSRYG
jgi:NADH-quinone oxidoreductase subunit J